MPNAKYSLRHKLLKRSGKIRTRKFSADGFDHYKIRLFLDGDLSDVRSVEYTLHPTFSEPRRVITDAARDFALDIWTWGEFAVGVTVLTRGGAKETFEYQLRYSDELPPEDSAYTSEGVRR